MSHPVNRHLLRVLFPVGRDELPALRRLARASARARNVEPDVLETDARYERWAGRELLAELNPYLWGWETGR